jgi:hypothetical protein
MLWLGEAPSYVRTAGRRAKKEVAQACRMTFTFNTGMLIALERRKRRATEAFRAIVQRGYLPTVPAVVYVEWWRGRSKIREEILAAVLVEDMRPALCRAAGWWRRVRFGHR